MSVKFTRMHAMEADSSETVVSKMENDKKYGETLTLPPYSSSTASTSCPSSPISPQATRRLSQQGLPPVPRTNFLSVQRHNSCIKGSYVIDPTLMVPESLLDPLEPGEERHNLRFDCQNGAINAQVFLVGGAASEFSQESEKHYSRTVPTTVVADCRNGSVTMKMMADPDHPFAARISTKNGGISLSIPRSFTGPITIRKTNGRLVFSPALNTHVAQISETKDVQRCFVGDFGMTTWVEAAEDWEGSSIEIECQNGRTKISYTDEVEELALKRQSSFWSKLLRFTW